MARAKAVQEPQAQPTPPETDNLPPMNEPSTDKTSDTETTTTPEPVTNPDNQASTATINVDAQPVNDKTSDADLKARYQALLKGENIKGMDNMTTEELKTQLDKITKRDEEARSIDSPKQTVTDLLKARESLLQARDEKRMAYLFKCEEKEVEGVFNRLKTELSQKLQRALEREDSTSNSKALQVGGHGLYAETNVGGHTAFGIGYQSGEGPDAKRTGLGVYLRADHFSGSEFGLKPASVKEKQAAKDL